jgi:hypothetical protein
MAAGRGRQGRTGLLPKTTLEHKPRRFPLHRPSRIIGTLMQGKPWVDKVAARGPHCAWLCHPCLDIWAVSFLYRKQAFHQMGQSPSVADQQSHHTTPVVQPQSVQKNEPYKPFNSHTMPRQEVKPGNTIKTRRGTSTVLRWQSCLAVGATGSKPTKIGGKEP